MGPWDVRRQPKECVALLQFCQSLLPAQSVKAFHAIVLTRLQRAVEQWDPLGDPIPVNTWTHPWRPVRAVGVEWAAPPPCVHQCFV